MKKGRKVRRQRGTDENCKTFDSKSREKIKENIRGLKIKFSH
jgi:hypothetical protein